ncbi:Uncharacterised protein [Mycobacteroides abscessus subsp. abscessus]|nr:Uncharacterised protein [Mycobacteroides abscessus subsp. abscessus]
MPDRTPHLNHVDSVESLSADQNCVTRTNCEADYDLPGHSDNARNRADH